MPPAPRPPPPCPPAMGVCIAPGANKRRIAPVERLALFLFRRARARALSRPCRSEIANALSRIERVEPVIAAMLRRCVSPQAGRRPSPLALIKAIKKAGSLSNTTATHTGKVRRRSGVGRGFRKR